MAQVRRETLAAAPARAAQPRLGKRGAVPD
jgi:hypothetical protein